MVAGMQHWDAGGGGRWKARWMRSTVVHFWVWTIVRTQWRDVWEAIVHRTQCRMGDRALGSAIGHQWLHRWNRRRVGVDV